MEGIKNRYLVLIILLLTSLLVNFLSYDTYYRAEDGIQAVKNIPRKIERWYGQDIPLESRVYEILETKSIINRIYHTGNGHKVLLTVVYYPETKVDFHAPESCLGGKGIQIHKASKALIIVNGGQKVKINLNQLIWQQGGKEKLVYYFYKAGEFLGESYLKLRFSLAVNKFISKQKSGSLIQVSTHISSGDMKKASEILQDFITHLYPFLIENL